ncbi:MAG: hypothetical protein LQ341_004583 [Variospora aurantia]|nr:MAG: hypothetical protein LQ341_004583 [Variospora aurantia]
MTGPTSKRSRSSSSVSDAQLDERNATPSDQKSRERKSDPYRDPRYETLLGAKGSFLKDSRAGVLAADSKFCMTLLNFKKNPPSDTLFDDRFFAETMDKIQNENEARVVRDIGQLISPSAECLATRGIRNLHLLKESTNAGWNQCIPFEGPRPQPDFCVGFERNAFSDDQLKKLGFDPYAKTHFTATYKIYFPFLTSEVKCGQQGLDIADRQNAHSMTVAVRGIVELYRIVGRAQELHRKVLGFSLSHDHRTVKIYSHYAEIDGPGTTYYRHVLEEFAILGREDPALSTFSSIQSTEKAVSSQDMMLASAHLSQDVNFNKPTPRRLGPVADLRAQLEMLRQEAKEEKEELRVQNKRLQAQVAQLINLLAQGREKASNDTGSLSK